MDTHVNTEMKIVDKMDTAGYSPIRRNKLMQGTNIKAVRLKRGMSQQELADAIGVTKSTISKYEKGQKRT